MDSSEWCEDFKNACKARLHKEWPEHPQVLGVSLERDVVVQAKNSNTVYVFAPPKHKWPGGEGPPLVSREFNTDEWGPEQAAELIALNFTEKLKKIAILAQTGNAVHQSLLDGAGATSSPPSSGLRGCLIFCVVAAAIAAIYYYGPDPKRIERDVPRSPPAREVGNDPMEPKPISRKVDRASPAPETRPATVDDPTSRDSAQLVRQGDEETILVADIEQALVQLHEDMYVSIGWPKSEARARAEELLSIAKRECKEQGVDKLPDNFGNVLLEREATDRQVGEMLTKVRREGARDEDIRHWWNLHHLERQMMIVSDNLTKMAIFAALQSDGRSNDEAVQLLRKQVAMYGDPDDTTHATGDDRPLPYELKDRVNRWMEKMTGQHPFEGGKRTDSNQPVTDQWATARERVKALLEKASSMNALIRSEIRAGRL